jgi:hypothetical protein
MQNHLLGEGDPDESRWISEIRELSVRVNAIRSERMFYC